MKKLLNRGFILVESVVSFSLLTLCILFYLTMQIQFLAQTASLQERVNCARVLYEETISYSPRAIPVDSYLTYREDVYVVRFYQQGGYMAAVIESDSEMVEIFREK